MADDDPTEQHAANAQSNTAKLDVADKQPDIITKARILTVNAISLIVHFS